MESPKRKMQKKNDYQRHKLFRKIKRRRKAQAEAEQQIAEKQLRKKLKLPKFDRGEDELSTYSDIRPQNAGIDKNGNFGFLDLIIHDYNSGKDIRIKPSKRSTFTKAAKQHGMSVQGFANKVLRNPSKYSAAIRKKANFAHNAAGWKH